MKKYGNQCHAKSTNVTYGQGRNIYLKFCSFMGQESRSQYAIPPDHELFLMFIAYLAHHRRLS